MRPSTQPYRPPAPTLQCERAGGSRLIVINQIFKERKYLPNISNADLSPPLLQACRRCKVAKLSNRNPLRLKDLCDTELSQAGSPHREFSGFRIIRSQL